MLILMDCRPLQVQGEGSIRSRLIFLAAAALSRSQGVQWVLLVDQTYRPQQLSAWMGASALPAGFLVVVRRALPGRIGWRLWYDRGIARLVRRHRPDAVLLTGGIAAGGITIPQCLWMPERADQAGAGNYWPLYMRRLRDSLSRASLVLSFTDADWMSGADNNKMLALSPWPSEGTRPLTLEEREATKQEQASGKEYFLADVSGIREEQVTQLLKSFSLFKKRQLSNLQLILAGGASAAGMRQRLETYKYRQDVSWAVHGEDKLAAAAYAFLLPFGTGKLGVPVLDAWRSEVPVIIGKGTGLQRWAGDAVLVAEMDEPASLAGQMMTIYKDERLRRQLIEKGRSQAATYTLQRTVDEIWAGLARVIRQPEAGSM